MAGEREREREREKENFEYSTSLVICIRKRGGGLGNLGLLGVGPISAGNIDASLSVPKNAPVESHGIARECSGREDIIVEEKENF